VRPFYQYGPSGDELAVAQAQTGAPQRPRVASLAGGGFVVGWLDDFFDVQIQRFDDLAMSLGEPTSVCPEGAFWVHADLAIAGLQSGGFVVVWQAISAWDEEQDFDIWVRVYGDDGSPATDPEVVNVQAQGEQRYPDVASFPGGGFIVAWKSEAEGEGVSPGIFVQRYTESGEKVYH